MRQRAIDVQSGTTLKRTTAPASRHCVAPSRLLATKPDETLGPDLQSFELLEGRHDPAEDERFLCRCLILCSTSLTGFDEVDCDVAGGADEDGAVSFRPRSHYFRQISILSHLLLLVAWPKLSVFICKTIYEEVCFWSVLPPLPVPQPTLKAWRAANSGLAHTSHPK